MLFQLKINRMAKSCGFFRYHLCVPGFNDLSGNSNFPAVAAVHWTITDEKKPPTGVGGFMLALPIFPGSHPPSIVGAHELNFCVRDGNRWTLMTINTNYLDGS